MTLAAFARWIRNQRFLTHPLGSLPAGIIQYPGKEDQPVLLSLKNGIIPPRCAISSLPFAHGSHVQTARSFLSGKHRRLPRHHICLSGTLASSCVCGFSKCIFIILSHNIAYYINSCHYVFSGFDIKVQVQISKHPAGTNRWGVSFFSDAVVLKCRSKCFPRWKFRKSPDFNSASLEHKHRRSIGRQVKGNGIIVIVEGFLHRRDLRRDLIAPAAEFLVVAV